MKKGDLNKVTMYKTVRDWVKSKKKDLANLNHLPECLTILAEHVAQIDLLDSKTKQTTKGHTAVKSNNRKEVEICAKTMVTMFQNAATFTENLLLQHEVNFTDSKINRATDQKLQSTVEFILDKAKANLEIVAPYGLTSEYIEKVEKKLAEFKSSDTSPRQIKLGTIDVNSKISELIVETDDLLRKRMDVVVKLIKYDNPSLYSQYKSARKIVDR